MKKVLPYVLGLGIGLSSLVGYGRLKMPVFDEKSPGLEDVVKKTIPLQLPQEQLDYVEAWLDYCRENVPNIIQEDDFYLLPFNEKILKGFLSAKADTRFKVYSLIELMLREEDPLVREYYNEFACNLAKQLPEKDLFVELDRYWTLVGKIRQPTPDVFEYDPLEKFESPFELNPYIEGCFSYWLKENDSSKRLKGSVEEIVSKYEASFNGDFKILCNFELYLRATEGKINREEVREIIGTSGDIKQALFETLVQKSLERAEELKNLSELEISYDCVDIVGIDMKNYQNQDYSHSIDIDSCQIRDIEAWNNFANKCQEYNNSIKK